MDQTQLNLIFAEIDEAYSRLLRSYTNTKKKGQNNFTIAYLNTRLKQANDIIAEISRYNVILKANFTLDQRAGLDYFKNEIYDKILEDIDIIDLFFSNNIEKLTLAARPIDQADYLVDRIHEDIKLPEIHIPIFH